MDKEPEEKKESPISFHVSDNLSENIIQGIAFDEENVVKFGFKI